jgi:MarR-like DNA-binding transcriptional regulator SgrR of sgrS sRNA
MELTKEEMTLLEQVLKGVQAPLVSKESEILRTLYYRILESLNGVSNDNLDKKTKVE